LSICDNATPGEAGDAEPSPKVSASMRAVRIPMEAAIARFCVTARISRPSRVKRNSPSNPAKIRRVNTMIHIRYR